MEYLCDRALYATENSNCLSKEDAWVLFLQEKLIQRLLCFSPSLGSSSFREDLLSGSMWWLGHGQQKPGQGFSSFRKFTHKSLGPDYCVSMPSGFRPSESAPCLGNRAPHPGRVSPKNPQDSGLLPISLTKMGVHLPGKLTGCWEAKINKCPLPTGDITIWHLELKYLWTKWVHCWPHGAGNCSSPVFWKGCLPFTL